MAKNQICKRVYLNEAGEDSAKVTPETVSLELRFTNGHTITIKPEDFNETVQRCFVFHGAAAKIGDGAAKDKDEPVESKAQGAQTVFDRLMAGEWTGAREGAGPPTGLLAEAILNVKVAAGLEDTIEAITARLRSDEKVEGDLNYRQLSLTKKKVVAEQEKLKVERAKERAKKAAKAADAEDEDVSSL